MTKRKDCDKCLKSLEQIKRSKIWGIYQVKEKASGKEKQLCFNCCFVEPTKPLLEVFEEMPKVVEESKVVVASALKRAVLKQPINERIRRGFFRKGGVQEEMARLKRLKDQKEKES